MPVKGDHIRVVVVEHHDTRCRRVIEVGPEDNPGAIRTSVLREWARHFYPQMPDEEFDWFVERSDISRPREREQHSRTVFPGFKNPVFLPGSDMVVKAAEIKHLLTSGNKPISVSRLGELARSEDYPVSEPTRRSFPRKPSLPADQLRSRPIKPKYEITSGTSREFGRTKSADSPENQTRAEFRRAMALWHQEVSDWEREQKRLLQYHADQWCYWSHWVHRIGREDYQSFLDWDDDKQAWLKDKKLNNEFLTALAPRYRQGDPWAVEQYCLLVLRQSPYPPAFPRNYRVFYDRDDKHLNVMSELPDMMTLPVVLKNGIDMVSAPERERLFKQAVQVIAIRTLKELVEADEYSTLERVTFEGHVNAGHRDGAERAESVLVSASAERWRLQRLDLGRFATGQMFEMISGRMSADLANHVSLRAISPKPKYRSPKKGHTGSNAVSHGKLGEMNWVQLENRVFRFLRQQYYGSRYSVQMTRRSRDGGIDIILHDADTLVGGEIIVQVKQRRKAVEVDVVRGLYGTLIDRGAMKAILITTSRFGDSAKLFSRNKPLTLVGGAELAGLISSYG